jgi:hypothetical protein
VILRPALRNSFRCSINGVPGRERAPIAAFGKKV